MEKLNTAEDLVYFISTNHLALSRYDSKFIANIQKLNQLTSNQVILFHKLLFKYSRQLAKHELFPENLIVLPWRKPIVESVPEFTDAHILLEDGEIRFKCPFNRNFIEEFRKGHTVHYVWDRDNKMYRTKFGAHSLRLLIAIANKHFKIIHYCPITTNLLDSMTHCANAKYWTPTLVNIGNNLMIAALNEALYEAIKDIPLSTDAKTLAKLVYYGIKIDESLYDITDEKQRFICQSYIIHESSELLNTIPWLKEIGCDMVYISGGTMITTDKKKIMDGMTKAGLSHHILHRWTDDLFKTVASKSVFPVMIKFRNTNYLPNIFTKIGKTIQIVNSQSIEIK
jgi:hypothetical protein